MKTYILTQFLIIVFSTTMFGQCNLEELLQQLNSTDKLERFEALSSIDDCNLISTVEILRTKIFNENDFDLMQYYLLLLDRFNAVNIVEICYTYLEHIELFDSEDPLVDVSEGKLLAIKILFSRNDYTQSNIVMEYLNEHSNPSSPIVSSLLKQIIIHDPLNEISAKNILINLSKESPYSIMRYASLNSLIANYNDTEVITLCLNRLTTDDSLGVRITAFEGLNKLYYSELNGFLKTQINFEPSWYLRIVFCDTLLNQFGKPYDLKFVIDYQQTEPDLTAKSIITKRLTNFIPPRPVSSANKMIDTLRVYTGQLYQYGWITDNNTYLYYLSLLKQPNYQESILKAAKRNLKNINLLLTKVEADLSSGLLTEEGYKFMHYYSIYIKEELQKIIDGSTLRIK